VDEERVRAALVEEGVEVEGLAGEVHGPEVDTVAFRGKSISLST
jgi:hypothetical protein